MGVNKPSIVMMSDFGIDSGLVSCMHGICKIVDKELETYDITHLIPAFDIETASYTLQYTVPCWPEGTVFVSVVDPGVGTSRRASIAKLKNGSYVATPDNGTLTHLSSTIGIESIREIDEDTNRYEKTKDVHTFHGRDLFSYCAAKLASGLITFEGVGKEYPVEEIVKFEIPGYTVEEGFVKASIKGYDPFGSAELSVPNKEFRKSGFKIGDKLDIKIICGDEIIMDEPVPYERSFGFVPEKEKVIFNDLASYVTIACNVSDFAKTVGLDLNKSYDVEIRKHI